MKKAQDLLELFFFRARKASHSSSDPLNQEEVAVLDFLLHVLVHLPDPFRGHDERECDTLLKSRSLFCVQLLVDLVQSHRALDRDARESGVDTDQRSNIVDSPRMSHRLNTVRDPENGIT